MGACFMSKGFIYDLVVVFISRVTFNNLQAQKWWQVNYDKVKELYNVERLHKKACPLPTPPESEDEGGTKFKCNGDSPTTPGELSISKYW
ncbi:putative brevis radix (BRX) domain-containing protein [Helianthus annuus]|uniref:Brevis radix (BRX) domain-containing protein n=2 Tax=Helianthus annuus TaxID=4232 RepID=A0A9K3JML9_HELAN|nr:putative brevis radix (BRX) domain-containing protein [Helianthus annuus]KAJ0951233.1 putative brevis radix (BRX) domain-containing protein [Helianthus annuus]